MTRKLAVITFGCKVSQYEAQVLREKFVDDGWTIVPAAEQADRVIINSCVVTGRAESEALRLARRTAAGGTRVTLTGCIARMPCVPPAHPKLSVARYEELLAGAASPRESITSFTGRSRAFLKVEDGCNRRCAYCLVSRIRGPVRSKPVGEVLEELQTLAAAGYREVVLSGINLGLYGLDRKSSLRQLLTRITGCADLPANFRIRLSSLEPDRLSPELIDLIAAQPMLQPHLHLPLQSGSDRILALMDRGYRVNDYRAAVKFCREHIPELFLSTDLMVGFPGETAADFRETVQTAREISFQRVHIFRFSPRPGTPAAGYPDQVPEKTKRERRALLHQATRHEEYVEP